MLRDYQMNLAEKAYDILMQYKIVVLNIEMRVGKTLIALATCEKMQNSQTSKPMNVLFITKKKAIPSIQGDFDKGNFTFHLTITNYEQTGKLEQEYDIVIVDESHSLGAFPKPSLRTQNIKQIVKDNYLMLLSGTLTPESYSQIYHQFWISDHSPFKEYKNFYKWAKIFVDVKLRIINGVNINDYSRAKRDDIMNILGPYFITYTRAEAGFEQAEVQEKIIKISNSKVKKAAEYLLDKRVIQITPNDTIVCDTAAKLQIKLHQIYSGTIKTEEGNMLVLDTSKANYIQQNYSEQRIAIYYKFIAEGKVLKEHFKQELTESAEDFADGKKRIYISQIQSGSMGINLASADVLIFYNIDFSAVQYWQARARLQTLNRTKPAIVHWLFTEDGIEEKIYKAVLNKKDYTTYYFKKDYLNEKIRIGQAV